MRLPPSLAGRPAVWITLLAVLMAGVDLGRRILANNDEARFPMLAQDMLERGAWLFPALNGAAYHAKPLLLAWLIALFSWPAGHVTQLTGVLPSALAAIGTALVVHALGRDMLGAAAGRFAALVALTTQGWFLHARLPMPDMLMTFFITSSLLILWRMVSGRRGGGWLGFYALVAAAFWAKGPAGFLPLGVVLAWGLSARRADRWQVLRLPAGLGVLAVLVAPWWLRGLLADAAAVRHVLVWDHLLFYAPRSLTTALFTEPLQHLVGILFPWVLVLPMAAVAAAGLLRGGGRDRDGVLLVVIWAVVVLVALGVAGTQRLRYYLPLVPPVSLLIGWWWAAPGAAVHPRASIPWRLYLVAAAAVAAATAGGLWLRPTWSGGAHTAFPTSVLEAAVMAGGLLLMLGALAHGLWRRRLPQAFALAWLGGALWVTGWYHWELERRNAAHDYPRALAEAGRLLPEAPVAAAWGVAEMPFSFYFRRPVVAVDTDGELRQVIAGRNRASAVLTEAALARVEDRERLRVLPLRRLSFEPIVLVTSRPEAPRAESRP